jgi:hypothetical protein
VRLLQALLGGDGRKHEDERRSERELIDWVEKQALENLRFRIQDAENISKESNTTLTILLAALGGGIAYTAKLLEADSEQTVVVAMATTLVYIAVLCAVLLQKCMKIVAMPVPTNEPRNLFQKRFSLDAIREVELSNVQARIDEAVARNDASAAWLNRVRFLAILAPLVFGIALGAAAL